MAAGLSILSSAFSLYKYRDDIVKKIPAEQTALHKAWTALQSPTLTDETIEGYEKKYFNVTIDGHLRSFHEVAPHIQTQYRDALATINGPSSDNPRDRRIQALKNHITMQYHAQQKEREGQWWGVYFRAALIGANISQLTLLGAGIIGFAALASNPVGWGIAGAIMGGFLSLSAIALFNSTYIRLSYRSIIKPKHHGFETLFKENNPQVGLKNRFKGLLSPMNTNPNTPLDRTDTKERMAPSIVDQSPLLTGWA